MNLLTIVLPLTMVIEQQYSLVIFTHLAIGQLVSLVMELIQHLLVPYSYRQVTNQTIRMLSMETMIK